MRGFDSCRRLQVWPWQLWACCASLWNLSLVGSTPTGHPKLSGELGSEPSGREMVAPSFRSRIPDNKDGLGRGSAWGAHRIRNADVRSVQCRYAPPMCSGPWKCLGCLLLLQRREQAGSVPARSTKILEVGDGTARGGRLAGSQDNRRGQCPHPPQTITVTKLIMVKATV
jgi:hypothetical protein